MELPDDDCLSSPGDSPARTSLTQGAEPAWRVIDPAFGSRWHESFAFWNPEWSSSKTSQDLCVPFLEAQASLLSESSSLIWPNSGMTLDGVAYELPTWELLISVPESSFSLGDETLLPTPSAAHNDGHDPETFLERREEERAKGQNGNGFGLTLGMAVQLMPTPQAADADGGRVEKRAAENGWKRPSGAKAAKPLGTIVTMIADDSRLLPTPSAYESTPTDEYVEEVRENLDDPHSRLYLPGRKWHAQRTLSRMAAAALLPSPAATDSKGQDQPNREGGTSLRELGRLLPTPQKSDGERGPDFARQRERAETHGSGGDDLTTTVTKLSRGEKLLPTPQARDGENSSEQGPRYYEGEGDNPTLLGAARRVTGTTKHAFLPTPVANPDNPGTGGELRAALTHGPGRRNQTGIDSWGRPNEGRPSQLLPTPTAQDAHASGGRNAEGSKAHAGTSLTDAVRADRPKPNAAPLLPTPQTRDGDETGRGADPARFKGPKSQGGRRSNLDDCIAAIDQKSPWLASTGESMNPPSPVGKPSPDQPQPQLTIEDA